MDDNYIELCLPDVLNKWFLVLFLYFNLFHCFCPFPQHLTLHTARLTASVLT